MDFIVWRGLLTHFRTLTCALINLIERFLLLLNIKREVVMPGRGDFKEYCTKAAKEAKQGLELKLENSSDECKAVYVRSVFKTYAAMVFRTEESNNYDLNDVLDVALDIIKSNFESESDEVRSAAMGGVYDIFNASIVPNYILGAGY